MKKILLIAGIAALGFTSCEDATDIVQPSEFNFQSAFQSAQDVKDGVFIVYTGANSTSHIRFASEFTDEGAIGEAGGNGSVTERLILNAQDGNVLAIWTGFTGAVRNSNILFEGARNVSPTDPADVDLYNQALGENHALRAYAYIQLMAHFTPDLTNMSSPSVPVFDFIPEFDYEPARNTLGEVVAFINADLNEAERLLTASGTAYSDTFISVEAVQAMRARMNAYIGNYGDASTAANAVLGSLSLPNVASQADYRAMWEDAATSEEVIFKFNNTLESGSSIGQIWNTNASTASGSPLIEVGRNLYQELEDRSQAFGDIRRQVFIDPTSIISPDYANTPQPRFDDILVVDKYPGDPALPGLVGGYTNDQKAFRTVEMHFILAEAAANAGNFAEVGNQLKIIRDARYNTPQPAPALNNATAAWAEIVEERWVELAWEGHRYVDLKRLGSLANQGIDRDETDCTLYSSPECDLSFTDFRLQSLPIPANELRANSNIAQNPGY